MNTEIHVADAGAHRSVRIGDRATVRLPQTPTTGYRWQVVAPDPRLRLVDDRFETGLSPCGAGGLRVLVFEAVGAGPVRLQLTKNRSWGGAPPIEEFAVDLNVQPQE